MGNNCLECGKFFVGRSDKIYCCDACRNAYNNALNRNDRIEVESINKRLKRNMKILKNLCECGKKRIPEEVLTSMGFDFRYVTSTKTRKDGKVVMQCYNYTYINCSNGTIYITLKNN